MQWSEVIKAPSTRTLRQFAGLFLVVFLAFAASRWFRGLHDVKTMTIGIVALVVGLVGMALPSMIRPIYQGWMIAAFPIGWLVSKLILAAIFALVLTPIGLVFRLTGRDALSLRRPSRTTYWTKTTPQAEADYLRQS